jgi:hypothetical protein
LSHGIKSSVLKLGGSIEDRRAIGAMIKNHPESPIGPESLGFYHSFANATELTGNPGERAGSDRQVYRQPEVTSETITDDW